MTHGWNTLASELFAVMAHAPEAAVGVGGNDAYEKFESDEPIDTQSTMNSMPGTGSD